MKIFLWLLLITIMGSYTACHWDYHLSNYLFDKFCNEEDRVGLFIYERVELGEEYFVPFSSDSPPRDLSHRFIVGDNLMINRERLEQDYILSDYMQASPLSSIGPILSIETSVNRKSDGKRLGKAVSLASRKGWWHREILSLGQNSLKICPTGYDEQDISLSSKAHNELVKAIFVVTKP